MITFTLLIHVNVNIALLKVLRAWRRGCSASCGLSTRLLELHGVHGDSGCR